MACAAFLKDLAPLAQELGHVVAHQLSNCACPGRTTITPPLGKLR
jgi:hypothetical protein